MRLQQNLAVFSLRLRHKKMELGFERMNTVVIPMTAEVKQTSFLEARTAMSIYEEQMLAIRIVFYHDSFRSNY